MHAKEHAKEHAGYHPFVNEDGEEFGSFEVFYDDNGASQWSDEPRNFDSAGEPVQAGWYWWACFPGCLPDGDPEGPFATSTDAYNDARQS